MDDFGLVQMLSKPTRGDNVLALFLTSNQTLVNKVEILSGISDHEIAISNISVKPKMGQPIHHVFPLVFHIHIPCLRQSRYTAAYLQSSFDYSLT